MKLEAQSPYELQCNSREVSTLPEADTYLHQYPGELRQEEVVHDQSHRKTALVWHLATYIGGD